MEDQILLMTARRVTGLGLLIGMAIGCASGRVLYTSVEYQGTVTDLVTRQPLAGAVAVAIWYREAAVPGGGHGPATDYHDALEIVTDAEGRFTIPERRHVTLIGRIRELQLVAYYPGYAPYPSARARPNDQERIAAYEKRVFQIELPKLVTRVERMEHARIPVFVDHRIPNGQIPNLIWSVNKERAVLGLEAIRTGKGMP